METELTIGQSIRKARGKVTLKELAERTGYSLTYLSDIQCDKTMPSLKALLAIAKAVDVTPGMILDAVYDPGIYDRDTFEKRIMAMYDAASGRQPPRTASATLDVRRVHRRDYDTPATARPSSELPTTILEMHGK